MKSRPPPKRPRNLVETIKEGLTPAKDGRMGLTKEVSLKQKGGGLWGGGGGGGGAAPIKNQLHYLTLGMMLRHVREEGDEAQRAT